MITSTANSKVKRIVQLQKKARLREQEDVFIIEGIKMFLEAPADSLQEVFIATGLLAKLIGRERPENQLYAAAGQRLQQLSYEEVAEDVFLKMSDTLSPQGILCVVGRMHNTPARLLAAAGEKETEKPLYLVVETLQDPGNLGTIIRTAEGAGITGIIMDNQTVDVYNPKVLRATMGSVFRVPFAYTRDLVPVLENMTNQGIAVYAAHLNGAVNYDECSYDVPCAFAIGNEGAGLSERVLQKATGYIRIPMHGAVESLNASVAAAIVMYEADRQRRGCR